MPWGEEKGKGRGFGSRLRNEPAKQGDAPLGEGSLGKSPHCADAGAGSCWPWSHLSPPAAPYPAVSPSSLHLTTAQHPSPSTPDSDAFLPGPLCRCRGREEETACPVRSCARLCAWCRTASDQVTFLVASGHKHLKVWAAPRLMMGARAGSLQRLKITDLRFPETSQAENCPEKSSDNKSLALQVKQQR